MFLFTKRVYLSKINNMKNIDIISPYSDQELNWNEQLQHYELTDSYITSMFENNFADAQVLKNRLRKNSFVVYNSIYRWCCSANIECVKKLLNNTKSGREFIKQALTLQMESDLEYATNDLGLMPRINTQTGKVISKQAVAENRLCDDCESFIRNTNNYYFGFNILYTSVFPRQIFLKLGVSI